MNTALGFTCSNINPLYWNGVEILAANQSVGVAYDEPGTSPVSNKINGATTDAVTLTTTHGATFVICLVQAEGTGSGTSTVSVSSTSGLTWTLLVPGDHTGQNGSDGKCRVTAIFGAYTSGSLTSEVITATCNVSMNSCCVSAFTLSGVKSSSPVGIAISPAYQANVTSLTVTYTGVTQGSQCILLMENYQTASGLVANNGSKILYNTSSQYFAVTLKTPAGIGVAATTTTGSGGFVVGGSATTTPAYLLGAPGFKYGTLFKDDDVRSGGLSYTMANGVAANGVFGCGWMKLRGPLTNDVVRIFNLEGSNWQQTCFPQPGPGVSGNVLASNWNIVMFSDLQIAPGSPWTYITQQTVGLDYTDYPQFKMENVADWWWYGVHVIPSVTAGITLKLFIQATPGGTIKSASSNMSLAAIRATAVTNGMASGTAATWVPDINCIKMTMGPAHVQPFDACRYRLYAMTTAPTDAQAKVIANNPYADPSAIGDWPLLWTGASSGTGVSTGLDVTNRGSGGVLVANSGQFFCGQAAPAMLPQAMLGAD
jgi:hypothetical protein